MLVAFIYLLVPAQITSKFQSLASSNYQGWVVMKTWIVTVTFSFSFHPSAFSLTEVDNQHCNQFPSSRSFLESTSLLFDGLKQQFLQYVLLNTITKNLSHKKWGDAIRLWRAVVRQTKRESTHYILYELIKWHNRSFVPKLFGQQFKDSNCLNVKCSTFIYQEWKFSPHPWLVKTEN